MVKVGAAVVGAAVVEVPGGCYCGGGQLMDSMIAVYKILTTFIDCYAQHSEDILCIRYRTCVDSSWHTFTAPSVEEDGTETSSGVDGNCVITNITTIRVPPQTTIGSCFT